MIDANLVKRLGFKNIFALNKDIKAVGHGHENQKVDENRIAFGMDKNQLAVLVKNGANAIAITDSYIDKKLMETIKKEKCVLCMPMSTITASYGVERSRNIYKMGKLFAYARKIGIDVCFVSMAKTPGYMNSYMQLIELAKLLGSDEQYARHSISIITKSIVEK